MVNQQKLKILYFCNGSGLSSAKSGGGSRLVEIIRRFPKDFQINIVGTIGDQKMFQREKISHQIHFIKVLASFWKTKNENQFDRLLGYLVSTIHSILIIFKLPKVDIVYSPSDVFCDVIPGLFYKTFKKTKWVVMVHHLCPPPWQRQGNFLVNAFSFLGQKLSFFLIGLAVDKLLVYDTKMGHSTAQAVQNLSLRKIKINQVVNGVDLRKIAKIPSQKIKYDACFAGGLRISKGIFDILNIWQKVCQTNPKAKLAVAGQGTKDIENQVKKKIKQLGLINNILLLGKLTSTQLYTLMKASKIFISVSLEEGWGIAIYEALLCHLPVIAYDLPIFPPQLTSKVIKVPLGKSQTFTEKILLLLNSNETYLRKKKAIAKLKNYYDWNQVANQEINILKEIYD